MKNLAYLICISAHFLACHHKEVVVYPLTENTWGTPEVLHVPDNVGFYTSYLGSYEFKADGSFIALVGPTRVEARWYWLEEGTKFKVDFQGLATYNDIYTIVSMCDTLLHVTQRREGEAENNGNYWEKKFRTY